MRACSDSVDADALVGHRDLDGVGGLAGVARHRGADVDDHAGADLAVGDGVLDEVAERERELGLAPPGSEVVVAGPHEHDLLGLGVDFAAVDRRFDERVDVHARGVRRGVVALNA